MIIILPWASLTAKPSSGRERTRTNERRSRRQDRIHAFATRPEQGRPPVKQACGRWRPPVCNAVPGLPTATLVALSLRAHTHAHAYPLDNVPPLPAGAPRAPSVVREAAGDELEQFLQQHERRREGGHGDPLAPDERRELEDCGQRRVVKHGHVQQHRHRHAEEQPAVGPRGRAEE
eukprot:scaffold8303_cov112-Isochrysis_galbana.AAC.1